jgi:hypothetical protein
MPRTIDEMLRESLEHNHLEALLRGEEGYDLPTPYMCPATLPTDWDQVLQGIYRLFREGAVTVKERLEQALLGIMVDGLGVYSTLNTIWINLMDQRSQVAPFVIDLTQILPNLRRSLVSTKPELAADYRWMGAGNPAGLWSEIERIARLMSEDYGIEIL